MWAAQKRSTASWQRSNSDIGSSPLSSGPTRVTKSLSRIDASQKPLSYMSRVKRLVGGPMALPKKSPADT